MKIIFPSEKLEVYVFSKIDIAVHSFVGLTVPKLLRELTLHYKRTIVKVVSEFSGDTREFIAIYFRPCQNDHLPISSRFPYYVIGAADKHKQRGQIFGIFDTPSSLL